MGHEIHSTHFKHYDFARFERMIERELEILGEWFHSRHFSARRAVGGLELEAWLVNSEGHPLPFNDLMLERVGLETVVRELSKFNIEFNVAPQPLQRGGIRALQQELADTWRNCERVARQFDGSVVAIGILPTITDELLSLRHMSTSKRYHALNEQVLRLRQGRPIRLEIVGRERLETEHQNVMLEAGTTSLQAHLQVPLDEAVRFYNAAQILSAPMVAVSANSPLLFGKLLWEETRIPLFEQATDVGGGQFRRCTFGSGYAAESLQECFLETTTRYPVMLPLALDDVSEHLAHFRLHNGTIWRWNRPLIGFDDDGKPHLRIEHRVMPAGPTVVDMTANLALFYGLIESLATADEAPESRLPFYLARENFYTAARLGLDAEVVWFDQQPVGIRDLLLEQLLPLAAQGLKRLDVDTADSERWLSIIDARLATGQNGAAWQRKFIDRYGRNLPQLTRAYRERQASGEPVHLWDI